MHNEPVVGKSERRNLAYEAALAYFVEQQTMEAIANKLGVSRSTVSRLIASAREEGLVRITLYAPEEPVDSLASHLEEVYDVNVKVVLVPTPTTEIRRLERVAGFAGQMLSDMVRDNMLVGVAWGTTVSTISERLVPTKLEGVTIVQLNGAANPTTTGLPYVGEIMGNFTRAFNAKALPFPVPAFFDYPETRTQMWKERSIMSVRDLGRSVDIALFGVGSFNSTLPSHVYAGGYLSGDEVLDLRKKGVVGDVCTVLVRGDGTYKDIEINARATGPTPEELTAIKRRICVVAGAAKAPAVAGVLRSGAVTDLIVDDECAMALLDIGLGRVRAPKNKR